MTEDYLKGVRALRRALEGEDPSGGKADMRDVLEDLTGRSMDDMPDAFIDGFANGMRNRRDTDDG